MLTRAVALLPVLLLLATEASAAPIAPEEAIALALDPTRVSTMGPDVAGRAVRASVAYSPLHDEYLVVWEGYEKKPYASTRNSDVFGQFLDAATGLKVGPEMFLISETAPNNDSTFFGAQATDVVYNANDDEYFVVWSSDDDGGGMVAGEQEIFGQRIDAATRTQIGADLRLSDMGPNGVAAGYDAVAPAVAHDPSGDTYLVVWSGAETAFEFEIYGQRLNASTGAPIGANDFRLSTMGPNGWTSYWASGPDVAFNSTRSEFLVAWYGTDDSIGTSESEVWAQRVSALTGAELGVDDRRITSISDAAFGQAISASIAYNPTGDEYLVVFQAHDPGDRIRGQRLRGLDALEIGTNDFAISGTVLAEVQNLPVVCFNEVASQYLVTWRSEVTGPYETTGQRLTATGGETGADDFVISSVAPGKEVGYQAVVWASGRNEYLAAWDAGGLETMGENGEEIYAQRLASNGAEIDDDLRITGMGDACFDAQNPAIAYNPIHREYLVVWSGDDATSGLVDDEFEIYGQLIDAETGLEKGIDDVRISVTGVDGDASKDAVDPAVAFCEDTQTYLVVWSANPGTGGLAPTEFEIFGHLVEAQTGAPAGGPDVRLSDMGPDGTSSYLAQTPAIAMADDHYLVVWQGDDDTAPLVDNDFEIFGRFVDCHASSLGSDFRISDMGNPGDTFRRAGTRPRVAYSSPHDEFLVAWYGDDGIPPLVDNENEIYGQRIHANTGLEVGANDFRISDMGPNGTSLYGAGNPALIYNATNDEYLVVWSGDDDSGGLAEGELEIFGQRLRASDGAEIGTNDFRISFSGPDGDEDFDAFSAAVAWDEDANQYLVAWDGESDEPPYVDGEVEIFAQLLDGATATAVGTALALSDMGPASSVDYDAFWPALTSAPGLGHFVVWSGDDAGWNSFDDEFEIFGQLYEIDSSTDAEILAGPSSANWLSPVSPNPSRGVVRFAVDLAAAARVRARLVDVRGRVVATLVDERAKPGTNAFAVGVPRERRWASGVYFLTVEAEGRQESRKVVLVR